MSAVYTSAIRLIKQDFSTCTFLFQDDVGGLEVEDPVSHLVAEST
jgi:isopenicillin N synthase-like dioxygenase